MPSKRAEQAPFDIRDNVLLARSFIEGVSEESSRDDLMRFDAVTRRLEIISQASRRLPDATRNRHPELPWRDIMGVGNIDRLDCDNVDELYVWRTERHSRVPLLVLIEEEIRKSPGEN